MNKKGKRPTPPPLQSKHQPQRELSTPTKNLFHHPRIKGARMTEVFFQIITSTK